MPNAFHANICSNIQFSRTTQNFIQFFAEFEQTVSETLELIRIYDKDVNMFSNNI